MAAKIKEAIAQLLGKSETEVANGLKELDERLAKMESYEAAIIETPTAIQKAKMEMAAMMEQVQKVPEGLAEIASKFEDLRQRITKIEMGVDIGLR